MAIERKRSSLQAVEKMAVRKPHRRIVIYDGPDPIDLFVGQRLRERRRQKWLSQLATGEKLGVTFQSVQKYENGRIRIAASTLYRLACCLSVAPGFFFEGYDGSGPLRSSSKQVTSSERPLKVRHKYRPD